MWDVKSLGILAAALVLAALPGCGRDAPVEQDHPRPGHMRAVSIERIERSATSANLIENGDFSVWHAGSPAPENFAAPTPRNVSELRRIEPRGGAGRHSADQWWRAGDQEIPYFERFHTVVPEIRAEQVYELSVHAVVYYESVTSVSAVMLDTSGAVVSVWPDVLRLGPGHGRTVQEQAKIRPSREGSLVIMSHSNESTKFEARMCWQEWRLTEATLEDGETAVAPADVNS